MKKLTREDILNSNDLATQELEVPAWGGTITIQAVSLETRNKIYSASTNSVGKMDSEKVTILSFVNGVIDPKFDAKDFDALKVRNAKAMDFVVTSILKLSGIEGDTKNG